jgi:hypothetical protein
MRYRLLETVRQYALEKLGESGEADAVRDRHRDYYTATAAMLESGVQAVGERLMDWAEVEIDNLRAAFAWSCENTDVERALRPASSLQPFWIARALPAGRISVVRHRRDRRARPGRGTCGLGARGDSACDASWRNTVPERTIFIRVLNPMSEALLLVVSSSRPAGGPTTPSR